MGNTVVGLFLHRFIQFLSQSAHEDSSDEEGGWDDGASGSRGEGDAGAAHDMALRPRTHSFSSASSGEPDGKRDYI